MPTTTEPEMPTQTSPGKPEAELLAIIDQLFLVHWTRGCPIDEWEGPAGELADLLGNSLPERAADLARLLSFNTACGVHLGKLASLHPERFSKRTVQGIAQWTVKPQPWED